MSGDVALAYLHPAEVGHNFCQSLIGTVVHDMAGPRRLGPFLPEHCSSGGHVAGRNTVAQVVLEHLPDVEWLWWVDADMGWEPDTLDRLLASADPTERPVMGGLCFAWQEVMPDGLGGFRQVAKPTIYDWIDVPEQGCKRFRGVTSYEADSVVRCAATGSAMLLIHRSALEAVHERYGPHWYDRIPTVDGFMGEDISFCARLGACEIPVHVDTSIKTNHLKRVYVSDRDHLPAA